MHNQHCDKHTYIFMYIFLALVSKCGTILHGHVCHHGILEKLLAGKLLDAPWLLWGTITCLRVITCGKCAIVK